MANRWTHNVDGLHYIETKRNERWEWHTCLIETATGRILDDRSSGCKGEAEERHKQMREKYATTESVKARITEIEQYLEKRQAIIDEYDRKNPPVI